MRSFVVRVEGVSLRSGKSQSVSLIDMIISYSVTLVFQAIWLVRYLKITDNVNISGVDSLRS